MIHVIYSYVPWLDLLGFAGLIICCYGQIYQSIKLKGRRGTKEVSLPEGESEGGIIGVPPLEESILVGYLYFLVDYDIPEDEDIARAVHRICLNRLGGPSGMRAEHLRQWLIAATRYDSPDATNWLKAVAIVQATFH